MSLTRVDLPGPGHPADADEAAQGQFDVDVLEVVLAGAPDGEPAVARLRRIAETAVVLHVADTTRWVAKAEGGACEEPTRDACSSEPGQP
jgi:hypothetical protein